MIWHRFFEDLPDSSVGLLEQHLTPEGVEFLRSNALSTGLFEHHLDLVREDDAPFLSIGVRDGDRLVRVTWAWHGALRDPNAAEATPGQATALESLHALITDPASWPASVWEDQEIREYVPATYAICSRGIPRPVDPARVLALMPEGARNLLGSGFGLRGPRDCAKVTTEEARTSPESSTRRGSSGWTRRPRSSGCGTYSRTRRMPGTRSGSISSRSSRMASRPGSGPDECCPVPGRIERGGRLRRSPIFGFS